MAETSAATQMLCTEEQLQELWRLTLQECIRYMEDTPRGKLRANKLEVVRAFLKDNHITIDGGHLFDVRQSLSKLAALDLPFQDH